MAEPNRGWMGGIKSVLTQVPLTSPDSNIAQHPRATLHATESRIVSARQQATMLHMQMQQTERRFQTTLADIKDAFLKQSAEIEAHYHQQVDSVQAQFKAAMDDVRAKYREAHDHLRREQKAFEEQAKHIDFKGKFIDHLPDPEKPDDPANSHGSDASGPVGPRS